MRFAAFAALGLVLIVGQAANDDAPAQSSGTLRPSGAPIEPPIRVPAGSACIVDLEQPYSLTGALSGSASIDYRIFVEGGCGSPPGTFAEHWIAYGRFLGVVGTDTVHAHFSYVAQVEEGGDVDGVIVVGDGVNMELRVIGNLHEDWLRYTARGTQDVN